MLKEIKISTYTKKAKRFPEMNFLQLKNIRGWSLMTE
jgi:hypothetical protein